MGAIAGASTGLVSLAGCGTQDKDGAIVFLSRRPGTEAKVVWSSCNVNCGSRCPLRLNVVVGVITALAAGRCMHECGQCIEV